MRLRAAEQESGRGGKQRGPMPGGDARLLLFPVSFSGEGVCLEAPDDGCFTLDYLKWEHP